MVGEVVDVDVAEMNVLDLAFWREVKRMKWRDGKGKGKQNVQGTSWSVVERFGKLIVGFAEDAGLDVEEALAVFGLFGWKGRGVFVAFEGRFVGSWGWHDVVWSGVVGSRAEW